LLNSIPLYHFILNVLNLYVEKNTVGATCGAGTTYPSRAP
jgi:hypothetical protein